MIAHALRQHAGIPYEVEQKVCSDCQQVLDERTVRARPRKPRDQAQPQPSGREAAPSGFSRDEHPLRGCLSCANVEGYNFSTDVVVRFAETDAQGIAHHASFVVWLEVARVAYLAEHAGGYLAIQAQGIEALTTEVHVRYHRAAHFDDRLTGLDALRRPARRALPLRVRDRA